MLYEAETGMTSKEFEIFWHICFQSGLPAIFATAGLFDTNDAAVDTDAQEKNKPQKNKKDRRKERHEQFLKSMDWNLTDWGPIRGVGFPASL